MTEQLPPSVAARYNPPKLAPWSMTAVFSYILRFHDCLMSGADSPEQAAQALEEIGNHLPCEVIPASDGSVYMRRFLVAEIVGGGAIYLQQICRPDEDCEHHSHPRKEGEAFILVYGYTEERLHENPKVPGEFKVVSATFTPGMSNDINFDDFHRIAKLNGPCSWSLFFVSEKAKRAPGEDSWSFKHPATGKVTGYKTFLADKAARRRGAGSTRTLGSFAGRS